MKDDKQLIKYKKENFFEKIKNKIIKIFSKKQNEKNTIQKINVSNIGKEKFFDIYEKVKRQEIKIETLDKETIRKILVMTQEELNLNNKKIEQKLKQLEISLENIKMYNKEIELLKNE